jgi:ATP diphosphatase
MTISQELTMQPSRDIARLIEIMAALRTPGTGCPWDLEQDFGSIIPYTIEEAYEVADAIERGNMSELCDELGDLLLQVAFHARMAEEQGSFAFPDVVEAITTKMIRRHPHVFGDETAKGAGAVKGMWDRIKAEERAAKADSTPDPAAIPATSALHGVPIALPGLTRAVKLQKKAGKVGFDWNDPRAVLAKIREEADEIEAALDAGNPDQQEDEIGDLLFAIANMARHLDIDPEAALRRTNRKFIRRFLHIESALQQTGRTPLTSNLEEMDALWDEAKRLEKDQSE